MAFYTFIFTNKRFFCYNNLGSRYVMNKKEIFYDEINYIKDEKLRNSLSKLVELLPDYFLKKQHLPQVNIILNMP